MFWGNCSSLMWNNWIELEHRDTGGLWKNVWNRMCVCVYVRVCECHVKCHPHVLHLFLPPLLSSVTVINDPQLSGTYFYMVSLSYSSSASLCTYSFYLVLLDLVGSNERTAPPDVEEITHTNTHAHTHSLSLSLRPRMYSMVCVGCVRVVVRVCARLFSHVCTSASHECAMRRRLKEARRRVSGVALSFLPLSSHRSRPDDGWWRMRSFLSWTADCSRLPSEDRPSAFYCMGQAGALGFGLRWATETSAASRRVGPQRNEQPSENWQMEQRK